MSWSYIPGRVLLSLMLLIILGACSTTAAPQPTSLAQSPPLTESTSSTAMPTTETALPATASSPATTVATDAALTATANSTATQVTMETALPGTTEQAVAPETNPPGDIPDTQVFVDYTSSIGGYQIQAPEGWARTEDGHDVRFVDKLDGVNVALTTATSPPTAATMGAQAMALLSRSARAVQDVQVKDVQLPGGAAVLLAYTSNSDPDAVTGKQVRLEDNSYLFFKDGQLAMLTLWAPLGADNVDQWQQIARSFRWS